jgi:hypothetical protein
MFKHDTETAIVTDDQLELIAGGTSYIDGDHCPPIPTIDRGNGGRSNPSCGPAFGPTFPGSWE